MLGIERPKPPQSVTFVPTASQVRGWIRLLASLNEDKAEKAMYRFGF